MIDPLPPSEGECVRDFFRGRGGRLPAFRAAASEAAASHWMIWSWLTQLHDAYDLTITLSARPVEGALDTVSGEEATTDAKTDSVSPEDDTRHSDIVDASAGATADTTHAEKQD